MSDLRASTNEASSSPDSSRKPGAAVTTVFVNSARHLGAQVREAALDHPAFEVPLKRCELQTCQATCCHDGVRLPAEDAAIVQSLVDQARPELAALGVELPDRVVEEFEPGRWKSVSRPAADDELAADFPDHFPRTRCVFLDDEHRCVLQRLSSQRGEHPWHLKPLTCWLQPLSIRSSTRGERPRITLATRGNDPAQAPGYPGFSSCTPCGRCEPQGPPARLVLAPELAALGELGRRDLEAELNAGSSFPDR